MFFGFGLLNLKLSKKNCNYDVILHHKEQMPSDVDT